MEAKQETIWLRNVFPEEIWVMIGKKIKHIHDHLRLRDSSAYFRFLFKNELDRTMFSEVAKILHVQLMRYEGSYTVMEKCRLVCRNWQKCVDAASENFPIVFYPLRNVAEVYGVGSVYIKYQNFVDSEIITMFRQHFAQTHSGTNRNPFPSRSVSMDFRREQLEAENLIEQVLELFREYGQHICHSYFLVAPTDLNALAHYEKLHQMLELMPNLQTLILYSSSVGLEEATLSNLELYWKKHPFPTFRHLSFLQIYDMPDSVTNALLRTNPQITMLHASSRNHAVLLQENLPVLKLYSTVLFNKQQLRLLHSLPFAWPLRQMNLQITQGIPTKDLFELLGNRWSATLTDVKLDFLDSYWELLNLTPLQLPNLQIFTLKTICFTPLDFLLPTKSSLKTLSLQVDNSWMQNPKEEMQYVLEAEETVKFYEFCDDALESNIWSIFSNLRSVAYRANAVLFQTRPQVYRRFDWMIRQNVNL